MENRYYDKREAMSRGGRTLSQGRKIQQMVKSGYERSAGFKKMLDGLGINPADIRSVGNMEKLPVITREALVGLEQKTVPYGGLADDRADIDRIFISPGPVYEPHLSESDPLWARAYHAAGIRKGDIVLNAFSYHMVAAGLTFHGGLRHVGATVVPSGTSGSEIQVHLIRDLKVTAYTGTPSFLMAIIRKAEELGHDFKKDFLLRKASFAAEPLLPAVRETFEKRYGIDTYQMYGATEVGDVAYECSAKAGWHICEEVLVEIVDPQTGKKVPDGQLGEVVVTRFNDIFFLMRFGTGDLSRIITEKCPCGRTSFRLQGIAGRVGDAVKVRGMFVAPSQLKKIEEKFPGIRLQAVVSRKGHADHLTVRIEHAEYGSGLEESLKKYFKEICTVRIDALQAVDRGTLKQDDKLIVDQRSWS